MSSFFSKFGKKSSSSNNVPPQCAKQERDAAPEADTSNFPCLRDIASLLNGTSKPSNNDNPSQPASAPPCDVDGIKVTVNPTVLDTPVAADTPALPVDDCLEIFCGECPYDELREIKRQQMPQNTICLTYDQLSSLWRAQAYDTDDAQAVLNHLCSIGFEREGLLLARVFYDSEFATRTAFSLECCAAVSYVPDSIVVMLRDVISALLQVGANVALADFALDIVDKLFQPWLPPFFKTVYYDVEEAIILQFRSSTLAEAPNGQISMLGNLSTEGKTIIHTLGDTRRPVLNPQAASFLRVLAVAQRAGHPKDDEKVNVDPVTGEWRAVQQRDGNQADRLVGTPAVIIVDPNSEQYHRLKWKGNVLLFGAHFAEIKNIGGVEEEALYSLKEQLEGPTEALRFRAKMSAVPQAQKCAALQTEAYNCVQKAPQHSKSCFSSKH